MSEDSKSPTKIIREWWSVVAVFVGVAGGYVWLDDINDKRGVLEVKLEIQRNSLESKLLIKECELQYTILIKHTELDILLDEKFISEMETLKPSTEIDTPISAADRAKIEKQIQNAQDRKEQREDALNCQIEAKGNCEKESEYSGDKCNYLNFAKSTSER